MPTYNNISRMKVIPIQHIKLYYPSAAGSPLYEFFNLESGSSMTIAPITVPNDTGGETIVAYEQKIAVTILENDYGTKKQFFADAVNHKLTDVEVICRALTGQDSGAYMWVSPDVSGLDLKSYNLVFSFDFASEVPRLNLAITGLLSVELFQVADNVATLFSQVSGF